MAYEFSRIVGNITIGGWLDAGAQTNSVAIDTAAVYATSGDYLVVKFVAPVGQSAATFKAYVYCDTLTGTPTFEMEVYDSFDGTNGNIDRPDSNGSALSSSPNSVTPSASSKWCEFTCTVTLTQGASYFALIRNTHATPASNYATFRYRGGIDSFSAFNTTSPHMFNVGYSVDGCATAPTYQANGFSCGVIEFSDGTIMGNPYVNSVSHANNSNSRGNSFTPAEDMYVSGILAGVPSPSISGGGIYTTGGTTVASTTGDYHSRGKAATFRFAPVLLTGGTQYLVLVNFSGNSNVISSGYMGDTSGNLPASVLACRPPGAGYWDGTTAQRDAGTGTIDTTSMAAVVALVDAFPAIAGGSGGMLTGNLNAFMQ